MTNLELSENMNRNGWLVIPCEPGKKQTYCKWGTVTRDNYSFDSLWARVPSMANVAILCVEKVIVVDFDNHEPEPNGASLFRQLEKENSDMFKDCIIEATQSGGYHVYYRGD